MGGGVYITSTINPNFYPRMQTDRKGVEGKRRSLPHLPRESSRSPWSTQSRQRKQMRTVRDRLQREGGHARQWQKVTPGNNGGCLALASRNLSNTQILNSLTFSATEEAPNWVRCGGGRHRLSYQSTQRSESQNTRLLAPVLTHITYVLGASGTDL